MNAVTKRRRTSLGDTVTTRIAETRYGLREDITLEVIPLADINKPGRVWPDTSGSRGFSAPVDITGGYT